MKARLLKFQKTAPASKEQEVIKKHVSRRPADAFTAAVGCAVEDTTGCQTWEPPKPPKAKKPRKKDPAPPTPSPTPIEPALSDTEISDKEDGLGRKKKASITQMLDEEQEEDWLSGGGRTSSCTTKAMKHTEGRLKRTG